MAKIRITKEGFFNPAYSFNNPNRDNRYYGVYIEIEMEHIPFEGMFITLNDGFENELERKYNEAKLICGSDLHHLEYCVKNCIDDGVIRNVEMLFVYSVEYVVSENIYYITMDA